MLASGLKHIRKFQDSNPSVIEDERLRRGSVAIIFRIPGYTKPDLQTYLDNIPDGAEGEVLLIKRQASPRDRWSGHIALPGGRREPGETDLEAAVRETLEEVGVDLNRDGFFLGALDQRPLKISWNRKTSMILCPFVFILNEPDATLSPQWSEVSTTFWTSLNGLLDPRNHTMEEVPIKQRLDTSWIPGPLKSLVTPMLGNVQYSAIQLSPETKVCREGCPEPPYRMWGITLAILSDVFEVFQPGFFAKNAWPPTLSPPDMKFILWLLSRNATKSKIMSVTASIEGGLQVGKMNLFNQIIEGHFNNFPIAIFGSLALRYVLAIFLCHKIYRRLRA